MRRTLDAQQQCHILELFTFETFCYLDLPQMCRCSSLRHFVLAEFRRACLYESLASLQSPSLMLDLLLDLLLLLAYLSTRPLKWLTHPQRLKHHHLFLSVDPFLDVVPFPEEILECLVSLHVLVSQMLHLLHIDLLEQCADIDALNQLHDTLVQLLVVNLVLIVLLNHLGVLCSQHLLLARQPLLL